MTYLENDEEKAVNILNNIKERSFLTEKEVQMSNELIRRRKIIEKQDDILKSDYEAMNIVLNNLKETLKVNNHIKQGENELVCLDIDHINYLISILEGKDKNDL